MVKTFSDIQGVLAEHKAELGKRYPIKSLGVFGSYAKGEQNRASDVDILVEFSRPIGLLKFLQLEGELRSLLGVKVDLVTKKALKPRIGRRILKEVRKV